MVRIAVCSLFRDNLSLGSFPRYFQQLLDQTIGGIGFENLCFSWTEGDSIDGSWSELRERAEVFSNVSLVKSDRHEEYYGSSGEVARFRMFADYCNATIERVCKAVDYILWLESDLIIPNDYLERLLQNFDDPDVGIVAPNVLINSPQNPRYYYDTWAYRPLDGSKWNSENELLKQDRIEMLSVGSSWMYRSEIFRRGARHTAEETCVGFCRQAREMGYRIFVDMSTEIWHPSKEFRNGRWIG